MKSWWLKTVDGAMALELRDIPIPQPGPGQVRIRIRAAALGRGDRGGPGRDALEGGRPRHGAL